MATLLIRFTRLMFGLFLYALGIVLSMQAHIGYAPWDIFHAGLASVLHLQVGTITIVVGFFLIVIAFLAGEKFGIGSILNMVTVGLFMNWLFALELFPQLSNPIAGVLQLVFSLFVISFATYFYISSGFGAGPRDSIMVLLARKTKLPIGVCRTSIEVLVIILGYLMGGLLGWGTLLSAALIGVCIQLTFRLLRFDPTQVKHENFAQSVQKLRAYVASKNGK